MFSGWKMVFAALLFLILAAVVREIDPARVEFARLVLEHGRGWIALLLNVIGLFFCGAAIVAAEEKTPMMILSAIILALFHGTMMSGLLPGIR